MPSTCSLCDPERFPPWWSPRNGTLHRTSCFHLTTAVICSSADSGRRSAPMRSVYPCDCGNNPTYSSWYLSTRQQLNCQLPLPPEAPFPLGSVPPYSHGFPPGSSGFRPSLILLSFSNLFLRISHSSTEGEILLTTFVLTTLYLRFQPSLLPGDPSSTCPVTAQQSQSNS